jgi:hypothetical protein
LNVCYDFDAVLDDYCPRRDLHLNRFSIRSCRNSAAVSVEPSSDGTHMDILWVARKSRGSLSIMFEQAFKGVDDILREVTALNTDSAEILPGIRRLQ